MRMPSPGEDGRLARVVVREIIFRDVDGLTKGKVTEIFVLQCFCIVFRVAGYKNLSAVVACHRIHARLFGRG